MLKGETLNRNNGTSPFFKFKLIFLQERAERLFMTKGKKLSDLNPNLFAKSKPGKDGKKAPEKMKEIAKIEAHIFRFAELLTDVR